MLSKATNYPVVRHHSKEKEERGGGDAVAEKSVDPIVSGIDIQLRKPSMDDDEETDESVTRERTHSAPHMQKILQSRREVRSYSGAFVIPQSS